MLSKWPIRVKVLAGLGLLLAMMAILSSSGLLSTYAYRELVKSLSGRIVELPLAAELSSHAADMRVTLSRLRGLRTGLDRNDRLNASSSTPVPASLSQYAGALRQEFRTKLTSFEDTLSDYRRHLDHKLQTDSPIADNEPEMAAVTEIEAAMGEIDRASRADNWMLDGPSIEQIEGRLAALQLLVAELPSHLHATLAGIASEVRGQYRTLIVVTWITSLSAALVFGLFLRLFYRWILWPLRMLIHGSRKVAAGNFNYRIHLDTHDEVAELAQAMNDMTARFRAIRDDLDRQVQQRTKEVVRSEQLASVGFLAAGVAHEINNPLASIAMCAESLEGRMQEIVDAVADRQSSPELDSQCGVVTHYLRMIQSEAFRCKEITEKLLDFSRIGPSRRQNADLRELVQGVVEMIGHLGKYHGKQIELRPGPPVLAPVNAQEIKQVLLNLLTNALDSIPEDGHVWIDLAARDGMAELTVVDNGCGMEPDILDRVFEPFFTRRRAGQGTGLGLSISYRIVADHGGSIEAQSPGLGCGATFRIRLPIQSARLRRAA